MKYRTLGRTGNINLLLAEMFARVDTVSGQ